MSNVNLKEIEAVAKKFENDLKGLDREIRNVQSKKCNLKKAKYALDYESKMSECLKYEQVLKEAKSLLSPKKRFVTYFEQSDVDALDYDETLKAIKTIQSKKYHTRWLTPIEGDNDEYRNACKIEQMLLEHKQQLKPVDDVHIRKSDLITIIDTIESSGELSQDKIVELLKSLL